MIITLPIANCKLLMQTCNSVCLLTWNIEKTKLILLTIVTACRNSYSNQLHVIKYQL